MASKHAKPSGITYVAGLILAVIFIWSYWPTLCSIASAWRSDPDYTHGFLVLPLVYAIWLRRRSKLESTTPLKPSVWGLVLIAGASLLRIGAARYYLMPLDTWSIPIWFGGVVLCLAGWRIFWCALPSIAFLWFAAPLPDGVEVLLSVPLQQRAATGSAWVLQSLCQPAVASGTTLLLGAEVFEVERACSGLRMFLGSFAMATAFVFLASPNRAVSVALLLFAAPIAVVANIVRIVITALLMQNSTEEITRRFVHDFAGIVMIGVVFFLFVALVTAIRLAIVSFRNNRDRFIRLAPVWPVGAAIVVIGAGVWHSRQLDAVHASLLASANHYEAEQDWGRAQGYLKRYLQMNPDEPKVLRRLAMVLREGAVRPIEKRRALTAMTAAWRVQPNDLELGISLAELALELRRLNQVVDITNRLFSIEQINKPEHAEIKKLAARWRAISMFDILDESDDYAPFNWVDVSKALERAVQVDDQFPQHSYRLATVTRERLTTPSREERQTLADQIMDDLVVRSAQSPEAWLVRYRYRRRFHRSPNSDDIEVLSSIDADLDRAVELDAASSQHNVHILVAAAERMRERGAIDASLSFYEQAISANPEDVRPYLAVSAIWIERGTPQARRKAVEVLQQGLAIIGPEEVPLILPLIEQLVVLGEEEQADRYAVQAEEAIDSYPPAVRNGFRIQLQHVVSWRLAKQSRYAAAAQQLSDLLDSLSTAYVRRTERFVAQAWANSGQYYRMASDAENEVRTLKRAAALDPNWRMEYRWAMGRLAESRGELEEAIRYMQEYADEEDSLGAWLSAAGVAMRQQLLLPKGLRDWTQFRRALAAAQDIADERMDEVIVLDANYHLVLGQEDHVETLLSDAVEKYPESILLHKTYAMFKLRRDDVEGALAIADEMTPDGEDRTESLLLKKEIYSRAGRYDDAIQLLREGAAADGFKQLATLQVELARLHMQLGQWSEAKSYLDLAIKQSPDDLRVTEALSQLAWCVQDWQLLEECEASLRLMEGNYGPLWRTFRIRRILAQSNATPDDTETRPVTTQEVDALAQQLEVLYPHMQQTRIAAARVATYRGLLWKAVANYEEAWSLGLPRVSLAVDLIGLLNELGETEKAQRYVNEVRYYLSATENIIGASVAELSNETDEEAIRMAEALVRDNPQAASYLRLGRTLVLTALPARRDFEDRLRRAGDAFRSAVELAPDDTRTWAALFRYLVAVRPDPVEAQEVLDQLEGRETITRLNRTFALAQLNESIGNEPAATELYRKVIELSATHPIVSERLMILERTAQFFRLIDPEVSERCCRDALALNENALGPQQILLQLLLAKDTREAAKEAAELVERLNDQWLGSDTGKRMVAQTMLQTAKWSDDKPEVVYRRAVDILKRLGNKTGGDAIRLAELYLLSDKLSAAVAELSSITDDLPHDPTLVLDFLEKFDRKLYDDPRTRLLADRLYDLLEELPEVGLKTLDVRLRTALKRSSGDFSQRQSLAISIINRHARRAVDQHFDEQEKFTTLAGLMRHLILGQGWEFAEQLTKLTPELLPKPRSASALATALAMCDPDLEQVQLLAGRFEGWLQDYPHDVELHFAVANVRLMAGRYEEAISLYERCLQRQPGHAMVGNNLALALAFHDAANLELSFDILNAIIDARGRQPQFLDSIALLHLIAGESEKASELLVEILPVANADSVIFVHLARAWFDAGKYDLATYALNMADSRGVAADVLLPFDRSMYQQLLKDLREPAHDE